MAVNITTDTNTVKVISTTANNVKIVDNKNNTSVSVSQPTTRVIKIATVGPQGPTGAIPNTGSFATTGSNTFIGTQTITGSNGRLIYRGTTPVYPYTLAELHINDDYPWLERFYNDTFSTSSAVMAYFGYNDGRFVFHNESTQSIGLQVNGYSAENGLLVYSNKVAFVNNVVVTGSITAPTVNTHQINPISGQDLYIQIPSGRLLDIWTDDNGGEIVLNSSGILLQTNATQNTWTFDKSGSLDAPGRITATSFTGSLQGTASTALTASYINPLNQKVIITGSLIQGAEGNTASGIGLHAEGISTVALGEYSHAEGNSTVTSGSYSHAEGESTIASGQSSHVEGFYTETLGDYSHAEGINTIASGAFSHAEGSAARAEGNASHAEGTSTLASGIGSHAEGIYTIASGSSSHVEGYQTIALGDYQHVQGQYNITSSAQSAFIIGNGISDANRSNLVYASGSQVQITGSFKSTGSSNFIGSQIVTGSTRGNVTALSIATNTASINLSLGNFFTLQLIPGSNTYINPSNILPGQTSILTISTTGSATVSFPSSVKQPSGSAYIPTTTAGVDIVTLASINTSSLYVVSIKNMI